MVEYRLLLFIGNQPSFKKKMWHFLNFNIGVNDEIL